MLKSDLLPVQVSKFSGIELTGIFPQQFGWVLVDSNGIDLETGESTVSKFVRYQVIEINEVQQRDEKSFVHIAITGDWLPKSIVSMVDISNKAPKGNTNCRWVDVNLTEQNLVVYENCREIFATLISSAKSPAITPEGTFTIFYREVLLPLFSNDNVVAEPFYLQDVPWLLFFHENWAIHGTYWHDHFGETWSHGCINVSPYDARWLYQWAKDGDMILVHR
jgi:lipoprotein-anchoring transpeptidase ErfK/SrfK